MKVKVYLEKDLVLEHQLEEWKLLNNYVNQIDTGYQQFIVVIVAIFSGVLAFVSKSDSLLKEIVFVVPPGIIAVLAYLSYQFRITAILRGHLANLENEMNKTIKENVHLWNSALTEVYMAHNNIINNYMIAPMIFVIIILIIICFVLTLQYGIAGELFALYWIANLVFGIIVFIPFIQNESFRRATEDKEMVVKLYKELRKKVK